MDFKLREGKTKDFFISRPGRFVYGATFGFAGGYGTGELMTEVNNEFIHFNANVPSILVAGLGAIAVGLALARTELQNNQSHNSKL
jgi:hypothetical protein